MLRCLKRFSLENRNSSRLRHGSAGGNEDLKAEAVQSADEGAFELLDVTVIEVVCS